MSTIKTLHGDDLLSKEDAAHLIMRGSSVYVFATDSATTIYEYAIRGDRLQIRMIYSEKTKDMRQWEHAPYGHLSLFDGSTECYSKMNVITKFKRITREEAFQLLSSGDTAYRNEGQFIKYWLADNDQLMYEARGEDVRSETPLGTLLRSDWYRKKDD